MKSASFSLQNFYYFVYKQLNFLLLLSLFLTTDESRHPLPMQKPSLENKILFQLKLF